MKAAYIFAPDVAATFKFATMTLPQLCAALAPAVPDQIVTL